MRMKIVKAKGTGIDIIHTTTRKVKQNFFALYCMKCSQLAGYEEPLKKSQVTFKVECKAEKCDVVREKIKRSLIRGYRNVGLV